MRRTTNQQRTLKSSFDLLTAVANLTSVKGLDGFELRPNPISFGIDFRITDPKTGEKTTVCWDDSGERITAAKPGRCSVAVPVQYLAGRKIMPAYAVIAMARVICDFAFEVEPLAH